MNVARLQKSFVIVNALGLHARAAAVLVQTANRYRSEIHVEKEGSRVNGKSIMGVLTLAAAKGATIVIYTDGDDAEAALVALGRVVEGGFGET
jgi:phosphocarrier protein